MEKERRAERGLRMRELEALTGETKATILFWVSQGLLPPPRKTSRNMAWYDYRYPRMIEAIRFFQRQFNRSLSEIREYIEAFGGHEALLSVQDNLQIFLLGYEHPGGRTFSRQEFLQITGMGEEELEELLRVGLLVPREEGCFESSDINAAKAIRAHRAEGVTLEELLFYPETARRLSLLEVQFTLRSWMAKPPQDPDEALRKALRQAALARHYYCSRFFRKNLDAALGETRNFFDGLR
jgi:DNA-binding transcriptional MerR regulator